MSHTTESHRQVHVPRLGMVNVPAAVFDRIKELEADLRRWQRWMNPSITLYVGMEQYECKIEDVGHSEISVLIKCLEASERITE